jgi:hypothetical protein
MHLSLPLFLSLPALILSFPPSYSPFLPPLLPAPSPSRYLQSLSPFPLHPPSLFSSTPTSPLSFPTYLLPHSLLIHFPSITFLHTPLSLLSSHQILLILRQPQTLVDILGRTIPSVSLYFVNLVIVKIFTAVPLEVIGSM